MGGDRPLIRAQQTGRTLNSGKVRGATPDRAAPPGLGGFLRPALLPWRQRTHHRSTRRIRGGMPTAVAGDPIAGSSGLNCRCGRRGWCGCRSRFGLSSLARLLHGPVGARLGAHIGDTPNRGRPQQRSSTYEWHREPPYSGSRSRSIPRAKAISAAADTILMLPTVGLRATKSPRISSGVTPESSAKATWNT